MQNTKQEKPFMNTKLLEKANKMIAARENVALAVVDEDGYPCVCAMTLCNPETVSQLFMTTTLDSNKARCLQNNSKASICCYSDLNNITLVGECKVLTDQAIKDKCWQGWFQEIYTGGKTDPNYCVIQFTTKRAALCIDEEVAAFAL